VNWLDLVILVVSAVFAIRGLLKGAVRTAFTIAGLLVGIALAGRCYLSLAETISPGGAPWSGIAAYAIILIATLVAAAIVGAIVARLIHLSMLGWLDRLVGGVLGFVIGGLLCAALLAILSKYLPFFETVIAGSPLAGFLMERFPLLLALLPEEFSYIRDFFSAPQRSY